jgi:hypothetical protein
MILSRVRKRLERLLETQELMLEDSGSVGTLAAHGLTRVTQKMGGSRMSLCSLPSCDGGDSNCDLQKKNQHKEFILFSLLITFLWLCFSISFLFFFFIYDCCYGWLSSKVKRNEREKFCWVCWSEEKHHQFYGSQVEIKKKEVGFSTAVTVMS